MTSESLVTRWKWMNRLIESRAFSLLRPRNHRADGRKRSGVSRWVQKHKYTSKPILSRHFEPKISQIELWFCGQSPMYSYQQQGIWQLSSSFWMNARWLCSITIVVRFFVAPNCITLSPDGEGVVWANNETGVKLYTLRFFTIFFSISDKPHWGQCWYWWWGPCYLGRFVCWWPQESNHNKWAWHYWYGGTVLFHRFES